jgi:hypothetical protein
MPSRLLVTAAALVIPLLLASPRARADTATFAVSLGAIQLEEAGAAEWHPTLRVEIAFRAVGPLQLGAFVDGVAGELPFSHPAFGAGALAQLRPEVPVLGVVPHLEASVARLQLPTERQGRADAWSTSVGGGIGVPIDDGAVLEARLRRTWYYSIDDRMSLGDASWTVSVAAAFTL